MNDAAPLVNIGDLTKPIDSLVNRISDAVGVLYEPTAIRRRAKAEVDAEKIKALGVLDREDELKKVARRMLAEEERKQENVENILRKTEPKLLPGTTGEGLDEDWLLRYHEKARLIANGDAQELWAKILADEASKPGSFSKRSLDVISNLERSEAELFEKFTSFVWTGGIPFPVIYDFKQPVYQQHGINYATFLHLEALGLITFNNATPYMFAGLRNQISLSYFGTTYSLRFSQTNDNELDIGFAILTPVGIEIATLVEATPLSAFEAYCVDIWRNKGIKVKELDPEELENVPFTAGGEIGDIQPETEVLTHKPKRSGQSFP